MVQLNVEDDVVICATINDFCGSQYEFPMIGDINISLPPCSYIAFPPDCLELSGLNISFGWTIKEGSLSTNECPVMLKVLGSATTNAEGVAYINYKITQQDLDWYNANPTLFDVAACITNVSPTVENGLRKEFRSSDPIIIGQGLCIDSPCKNKGVVSECFGPDMWWVKCDSATGACVQDVLRQANHPVCLGATHVLEIPIKPYPWYTPQSAADELITKSNDINGAIMNAMTFLTGWSYVETVISTDANYVYLKVYLREDIQTLSWGNAAMLLVPLTVIVVLVGTYVLSAVKFGEWSAPTTGLTNGQLKEAIEVHLNDEIDDCDTINCAGIDPPLTQDQKVSCISICRQNTLQNGKDLVADLLPTDTTPLDIGISGIQSCYDIYNSSGKTEADYLAANECMRGKAKEAVSKTGDNIDKEYPPDAPAGVTADELAEDCWIPSPLGGCILTAETGKTIATIGGIAIGGYIIFKLIKR